MKRLGILAIISVMAFSCVMNKKVIYLQDDDYYGKNLPYNQWVNEYESKYEEYLLQPGDIISVRIGSLTPAEYNFIKEYERQLGQIRKLNQFEQNNLTQQNGSGARGGMMGAGGGGDNPFDVGLIQFLVDNFLSGFELDDEGKLNLPEIGELILSGKSIEEAESIIQDSLEGYFETPIVKVELMSFQFTIFGEIAKEGRYTSYSSETNIFDAIALAENLTEFADRTRIKLIRTEGRNVKTAYINLLDEKLLGSEFYYLRPGDKIIVPALKAKVWRQYIISDVARAVATLSSVATLVVLLTTL